MTLTNVEFFGVPYHSGEPFSTNPWTSVRSGASLEWSTTDFTIDPDANALRWSRMFNFRFDADAPPQVANASVGLFKTNGSVELPVLTPDVRWCPHP